MHKSSLYSCVFCLLSAFFLASCTPSGQMLSEKNNADGGASGASDVSGASGESSADGQTSSVSGKKEAASGVRALEFRRDGFSFTLPDTGWGVVSDPADASAPLEFFNAQTNSRAVIQLITLEKGSSLALMDRARMEMQSRESSGKQAAYAEVSPKSGFGLTGALWEAGGEGDNAPYRACGFVAGVGNHVFYLSLSKADTTVARKAFSGEWEKFFAGFTVDPKLMQSAEADVSKERVSHYVSSGLGYHWDVSDTVWHRWAAVAAQNSDPDLGDAEPPLSRGDGEGFAHHEQNTMGTVGGPTVLAALAGGPHRVTERGGDVGGLDLDERQMGCGVAASPASRDSRRPGGCKHLARRERERPLHTLGGPQRGAQEVFPPPDTKKSPPTPFPSRLVEQTQRFEIHRINR